MIAIMKSSNAVKGKETKDKLQQLFKILEQDWNSYKQSNPRTSNNKIVKALQLLDNSPRDLMSSLQQRSLSPLDEGIWKMRTDDLEVKEIIKERRAAIENGKLKRRRLFEPLLDRETEMGFVGIEDCEVRSMTFYDSESENYQQDDFHHCYSSSSSSSSLCVSGEIFREKDEEAVKGRERVVGKTAEMGNYIVFLGGLAIAIIIFAICIAKVKSFGGYEDEVILVPT